MSLKKIVFIIIAVLVIAFLVIYFVVIRNSNSAKRPTDNQRATLDSDAQETTNLITVGPLEGNGSGTATRRIKDGVFIHTITATIADAANDMFYEGWLVKGSEFFSTGKLTKDGGQYTLEYQSSENKNDYSKVVVTLETLSKGLDGVPETHVLEGSF